jgi:hypothetical protein
MAMKMRHAAALLIGCSILAAPVAPARPATPTGTFSTADEAATALIDAIRSGKPEAIETVLGPGSAKLVESGDTVSDTAERQRFSAAYDEHHELVATADRAVIRVGSDNWPLPIPLVQSAGRWHFDAQAGAQELVDRRIGRNELAAIQTALAYVDAQKAFFLLTNDSRQAEYAQRLISSAGTHDGLYWPSGAGEPMSPLGPLVEQTQDEGYPSDQISGRPRPYRGYLFRILTGQGPDTPAGALDYLSDGRMTKGFALIAWPASYGSSGIMSFIVNQDGIVFQKDLGPHTAALADGTKQFDPDLTWARIDLVN